MAVKQEAITVKKVTIVGGNGTVGRVLAGGLAGEGYEVTVLDLKEPDDKQAVRFIRVDATDYNEVVKSIPAQTNALINLLAVKPSGDLLDRQEFAKMTDIFFKATYTILRAAAELGVPKVVFASSNHVTDVYEKGGDSLLGRQINTNDYPQSKSLYVLLKLASENLGYLFSHQLDAKVSVINLRIGTAAENELETLHAKPRSKKTLLSHPDLIGIFKAAIESGKTYGTYYAVSDNKGRPWSIDSAIRELGYRPQVSASDILDED
nr:NAD(P)-dependent oxidoreductase [Bacillus licheniformis]